MFDQHTFWKAVAAARGEEAADLELDRARVAVREARPSNSAEEADRFLAGPYGSKVAAEVLAGTPVAQQIEERRERFRRHFEQTLRAGAPDAH